MCSETTQEKYGDLMAVRRLFLGRSSSGDSAKPHVGNPETSTKIKIGRVRRVFGGVRLFFF